MSSFICSDYHFKKMKEETILFLRAEKYARYNIGLEYDTKEDVVQNVVNNKINELWKINVASFNLQYNENAEFNYKETIVDTNTINTYSMERAISLYNAYKCLNYQIELEYNKDFVNGILLSLSDYIVRLLSDKGISYNINDDKINHWVYKEVK